MTNKEVMLGLYSGKIYRSVASGSEYRYCKVVDQLQVKDVGKWHEFIYNVNYFQNSVLCGDQKSMKTWWRHDYYSDIGHRLTRIIDQDWDTYIYGPFGGVLLESTDCLANTYEEAVRILERK